MTLPECAWHVIHHVLVVALAPIIITVQDVHKGTSWSVLMTAPGNAKPTFTE